MALSPVEQVLADASWTRNEHGVWLPPADPNAPAAVIPPSDLAIPADPFAGIPGAHGEPNSFARP